jgi:hypothetical protein
LRIGERIDPEEAAFVTGPRCASIDGVSLHANVAVPARDRTRLEKLCRYVARPPLAMHRLSRLDDGGLLYRLKRRWHDGTTHVVFEPLELIEKLVAIIPPPRCHMIRYHGVLAPRARWRAEVVAQAGSAAAQTTIRHGSRSPSCPTTPDPCARGAHESPRGTRKHAETRGETGSHRPTREPLRCGRRWIPWAELMRRVFDVDVLECPGCGSRMVVLDVVLPPDATRELLDSLQLPARAPPLEPACYESP